MIDKKITVKYIGAGILAVILTWTIHEFAHWLTSELLGYETAMYLNGTSALDNQNVTDLHWNIISAAGPIVTLVQGLVFFLLLKNRRWNKLMYIFLFTVFYMRLLAGLMNFINPNDEGRISNYLGLGTFTLPIIVSGILFFLVHRVSKKYRVDWKLQLATTLVVMVASSVLILADQFFKIRIL